MTAVYTTTDKVAQYLQRPVFSASTTPTSTAVTTWIEWSQSEIERKTNQAFQAITVSDEIHTMKFPTKRGRFWPYIDKPFVKLTKHDIRTFDADEGDQIEVFSGGSWTDWVATKTEGRDEDYWVDYNQGVIYFQKSYPLLVYPENVRVTYRWGLSSVPGWAEELCTLMAARRVLAFDYDRVISSEGGSGDEVDLPRINDAISRLEAEIRERLDENKWITRKKKYVIN